MRVLQIYKNMPLYSKFYFQPKHLSQRRNIFAKAIDNVIDHGITFIPYHVLIYTSTQKFECKNPGRLDILICPHYI